MKVEVFIPCFIDQLFPETGFNLIKLLEHVGCEVHYNPEQTCCGQPSYNGGYLQETAQLAKKFIADFAGESIIVSPGSSCTGFIRNHYPSLFTTEEEKQQAQALGTRIYDICDFLVNVLKITNIGAAFREKVTLHESCSALREYKLIDEPIQLLNAVEGLELIELPDAKTCCGFGGTFSAKQPDISSAMVEQKVHNALSTGVSYITSTEASCLMNIAGYIKKHKLPLKTIHIVDILAHNL